MSVARETRSGRRAAVLGSPIAHSLSPVLHTAAYQVLGLDWTYTRHEVDEGGLEGFLAGLDESWAGLSLTMPLKRVGLRLCDKLSETARAVGGVNTITFGPGGARIGDNTDVPGLVNALAEAGITEVPDAAVLGGGATAASALAALARICPGTIAAYVRSEQRGGELTDLAQRLGVALTLRPWGCAAEAFTASQVVATTPGGTTDDLATQVPHAPGALFDVAYDPWPTALAAAWAARSAVVLGGLDLLVHQAVRQVELMTGAPVPTDDVISAMRRAGRPPASGPPAN